MSCCCGCFAWSRGPTGVPNHKASDGKDPLKKGTNGEQVQVNNKVVVVSAEEVANDPVEKVAMDPVEQIKDFISKVPLFQTIPASNLRTLAEAFKEQEFPHGSNVINQGELGDTFYVVRSGKARVVVDGAHVNDLSVGDYFGELALLHNTARNATIIADGILRCEVMTRKDFQKLDLRRKLNFKKRNAVMMAETAHVPQNASPKTAEEKAFIKEAFVNDQFIGTFLKGLSEQQLQDISGSAFLKEVPGNTDIIIQGDTKADLFYIVKEGAAVAIKDGQEVAQYGAKGSFGGLALMYQAPRAATIRVLSHSKLWCIPRSAMRAVLQKDVKDQVSLYARILDRVQIFDELSAQSKLFVADGLLETTYSKGEFVTEQGGESSALFILQSGELSETENGKHIGKMLAENGKNLPCFGQEEILKDMPCFTSRQVLSDTCSLLVLNCSLFKMVFNPNFNLFDNPQEMVEYKRSDLSTVGLLGVGGFGRVTLEKNTRTGHCFAMKSISKGYVLKKGQQRMILNEERVMRMTHSQFLIQLAATFNTEQYLLFLLEPCLGGELFVVYARQNMHGKERFAIFYSACVIKGLQHLHERCIVYRDMKPENLLLDDKGYCKIADFGLAKFCVGKTFTTCGTPEYFAPELVKGVGHNTSLDWWTLGILIFEFMMGVTPFAAKDEPAMFGKILKGCSAVAFSKNGSSWEALVKDLLSVIPAKRLPVRPGGKTSLESHSWFQDNRFNWGQLISRKLDPPFVPKVDCLDASNFEASEDDAPPSIPYIDPGDGWDADFEDVMGPKTFDIVYESPVGKEDESRKSKKQGCCFGPW